MYRNDDFRAGGTVTSDVPLEYMNIGHELCPVCGSGCAADAFSILDFNACRVALEGTEDQHAAFCEIESCPVDVL